MMKIFEQAVESELEDSLGKYEAAAERIAVTDGLMPFVASFVTSKH